MRLLLPAGIVLLLAFPAAAGAADVAVTGATLQYAGGDQANDVTVTIPGPDTIRVTDTRADIVPGPGCTAVDDRRVNCASAGVTNIALDLRGGPDTASISGEVGIAALIHGGDGDDNLRGGPAADRLEAGPGDDSLDGEAGNDAMLGGDGADSFDEGSGINGADSLAGGDGPDDAGYGDRREALTIQLDDQPNDGQVGEGDDVRSDVERVRGGNASDVIIGSPGDNRLDGGTGDDFLDGRAGADTVSGGGGRDRIGSRDRSADQVSCGPDGDTVTRDRLDRIAVDCDDTRATAPITVQRVSGRLRGRRIVRLRVVCELTAFEACSGRVVLRTLRRVRTRSGRLRVVRLGSRTFSLDPGAETVLKVRVSRSAARLIRQRARRARATVKGGDRAGPTEAQTVFTVRR